MKLKAKVYDEDNELLDEETTDLNDYLEGFGEEDQTVRMYSGRKDRNSKRIFDGDKVTGTGINSIVFFDNGAFRLKDVSGQPVLTKELVHDKNIKIVRVADEDDEV